MKIKDLPHYVKFIFHLEENCFSTTDVEVLKYVKHRGSKESLDRLKVGDQLYFEPVNDKFYEVKEIIIRHIFDDLEIQKYGFDSEDCTSPQGADKPFLLSILVKTGKVN